MNIADITKLLHRVLNTYSCFSADIVFIVKYTGDSRMLYTRLLCHIKNGDILGGIMLTTHASLTQIRFLFNAAQRSQALACDPWLMNTIDSFHLSSFLAHCITRGLTARSQACSAYYCHP